MFLGFSFFFFFCTHGLTLEELKSDICSFTCLESLSSCKRHTALQLGDEASGQHAKSVHANTGLTL